MEFMTILIFIVAFVLIAATMLLSSYFRLDKDNHILGLIFEVLSFAITAWASAYLFNSQEFIFAVVIMLVYIDFRVGDSIVNLRYEMLKNKKDDE